MSALNKLPIEVKRQEDGGSFLIEGSSWSRYGNYFFSFVIFRDRREARDGRTRQQTNLKKTESKV